MHYLGNKVHLVLAFILSPVVLGNTSMEWVHRPIQFM